MPITYKITSSKGLEAVLSQGEFEEVLNAVSRRQNQLRDELEVLAAKDPTTFMPGYDKNVLGILTTVRSAAGHLLAAYDRR